MSRVREEDLVSSFESEMIGSDWSNAKKKTPRKKGEAKQDQAQKNTVTEEPEVPKS